MSASVPMPSPQWPLRPGVRPPRRDWTDEFLTLEREPGQGKVSGLSVTLANWLQIDPLLIRALFVITALSSGLGLFVYGAGWALTADARTGAAPLDKINTNWRQLSSRTVVGWAIAVCAIGTIGIAGATGGSWLAAGVLAGTAWLGWRARNRPTRRLHPPQPITTPARPPVAHARAKTHGTVPLALITIAVAFLAGMSAYEALSTQPWIGWVLALFIIGLGSLLTSLRGLSVLLVIAGLLTSLGLGTVFFAPVTPPHQGYYFTEQADLADRNLTNTSVMFDLTEIEVVDDQLWRVNLDSSRVDLEVPTNQNIEIQVESTDSLIGLPDSVRFDNGSYSYLQTPEPGAATLTIQVTAHASEVWVFQP